MRRSEFGALYFILLLAAAGQFVLVFEFFEGEHTASWRTFLTLSNWDPAANAFHSYGFKVRSLWGYEGIALGFILPLIEVAIGSLLFWTNRFMEERPQPKICRRNH